MTGNDATSRIGRPVDAGKHRAILEHARRMFAEHGIAGTNMDELADAVGVSKATIYSHFGGKRSLFDAILQDLLQQLPAPADLIGRADGPLPEPLAKRLMDIARAVRALATSALMHDIQRMLALPKDGGSQASFWQVCVAPYHIEFADLLDRKTRAGQLRVDDAGVASSQFFSLVASEPFIRMLMGEAAERRDCIAEQLHAAVATFLRAYRP